VPIVVRPKYTTLLSWLGDSGAAENVQAGPEEVSASVPDAISAVLGIAGDFFSGFFIAFTIIFICVFLLSDVATLKRALGSVLMPGEDERWLGVVLEPVDEAEQVRKLEGSRPVVAEEHLDARHEVVHVRDLRKHVVAHNQGGLLALVNEPLCGLAAEGDESWHAALLRRLRDVRGRVDPEDRYARADEVLEQVAVVRGQLARTPRNFFARIGIRLLALAACISLNHQLGRPSRAIVDYTA
jgi:hypothetical protein